MTYAFKYHSAVKKSDLPKIDSKTRNIIKRVVENRLAEEPEAHAKPLQRSLKGYWKLGVGDYRIIFKISGDDILIFGIIHRKEVYKLIDKRIETSPC